MSVLEQCYFLCSLTFEGVGRVTHSATLYIIPSVPWIRKVIKTWTNLFFSVFQLSWPNNLPRVSVIKSDYMYYSFPEIENVCHVQSLIYNIYVILIYTINNIHTFLFHFFKYKIHMQLTLFWKGLGAPEFPSDTFNKTDFYFMFGNIWAKMELIRLDVVMIPQSL